MQKTVSITSQGQLTIPQAFLQSLGIQGPIKAVMKNNNGVLEVKPKKNFWSLSGSLRTNITLTDEQLKKARIEFSRSWGRK